jgi:hypothetical protein
VFFGHTWTEVEGGGLRIGREAQPLAESNEGHTVSLTAHAEFDVGLVLRVILEFKGREEFKGEFLIPIMIDAPESRRETDPLCDAYERDMDVKPKESFKVDLTGVLKLALPQKVEFVEHAPRVDGEVGRREFIGPVSVLAGRVLRSIRVNQFQRSLRHLGCYCLRRRRRRDRLRIGRSTIVRRIVRDRR